MNNVSPQMPLPLNLSGGEAFNRKSTPGDVGDSLFRDFLQKVDDQDDDGVLAWLPLAGILNGFRGREGETACASAGAEEQGLSALGLGANRVVLSSNDLSRLAQLLERQGLPSWTVQGLLQSLADKNGDIRLDRLLARLRNLLRETSDSASSLVVKRSDVPRLEEALFKMGLGAEQVRKAVEKAMNAEGDLSVRGFVSALRDVFPDLTAETAERVQSLLQQETGVRFLPGDLRQVVRDAGLEAELNRLTGNASEASRHSAKQAIAALMQEKGIPPQEVKRFLESLRVRDSGSRVLGPFEEGRAGAHQKASVPAGEDPSVRVYIRREGTDWQPGGWKERILDILNRQETLAGRTNGFESGVGKAASFQELARMLEEAFSGRKRSGRTPSPWSEQRTPAVAGGAEVATKTGSRTKGPAAEPTASRPLSGAEFSLSRPDRAAASQPSGTVRGTAVPVHLPEPLPKIVDRMVWMVRAGEQTSRIQISPPELGRLELDVVIRQGHLHANLSAENPAVKELIEANLQQLRQQLNNLGFVVERFEVAAGLSERRFTENQAQFNGRRGRNRQGRSSGEVLGDDDTKAFRAHRTIDGLYRVDVHV